MTHFYGIVYALNSIYNTIAQLTNYPVGVSLKINWCESLDGSLRIWFNEQSIGRFQENEMLLK